MAERPVAVVRGVPDSFAAAVTSSSPDPPLSVEVARRQHAAYCDALTASGYRLVEVEPDNDHPDCLFVEDAAVVIGDQGLATRPGHESRRGEVDAVADAVTEIVRVHRTQPPATIDGGDVLVVGSRVFVGLSRRTNRQGAAAVATLAEPQGMSTSRVPVGDVLHLKSGLSAVDDETVLWHPTSCDRDDLEGVRVVVVPGDDPEAANVVRLADGRILVGSHHPRVGALVASLGHEVVTTAVSEIARADGGLTCMSIRVR